MLMINKLLKLIILHIHTLLLFVGIAFISISAFLYSQIIGFLVLGVACLIVSYLISSERG